MTHVTCRLTAKNRDQLRNPSSVIEYGLPILYQYNFRRAGQQGPTRTLVAALKRLIKVTGYVFYHTSKTLQTKKKTRKKSIISMLFLKHKDVKFTVDGSVLQTCIILSTKNFLSNASCASRHKQFILMAPSVSGSTRCKEITESSIH